MKFLQTSSIFWLINSKTIETIISEVSPKVNNPNYVKIYIPIVAEKILTPLPIDMSMAMIDPLYS